MWFLACIRAKLYAHRHMLTGVHPTTTNKAATSMQLGPCCMAWSPQNPSTIMSYPFLAWAISQYADLAEKARKWTAVRLV